MVSRPLQIVLPRTQSIVRERVVVQETPVVTTDFDTQGRAVPTNGPHYYTYDANNNLQTDTVSSAEGTWVRTFVYTNGNQVSDSGWVKQ